MTFEETLLSLTDELRADRWSEPLAVAMHHFEINTPLRQCHFLAQALHESVDLRSLEENLHYRPDRLRAVWPQRFDFARSLDYAGKPIDIANYVYAHRNGNGDEASGDGWRYRGRGLFQLTGRANYAECGAALGLDLLDNPDLLLKPDNAALSAGWFWQSRDCNDAADADNCAAVTRKINGGLNGLDARQYLLDLLKQRLIN